MMLDYRMLTFLTLCRELNYRRTAEKTNMSQPAVTQHIKYLEAQYGCKLFSYDKHRLSITPQGHILQRYGENMLYQESCLERELSRQPGRRLRIGTTKTIGDYVLAPHVVACLDAGMEGLSVQVDNTERLLLGLSEGKLDFALIEGYFDHHHFASRLYRRESFTGICASSHPFAGRMVERQELLEQLLLVREEGSGTREVLERMLSRQELSLEDFPRRACLGSMELIARTLALGRGISFAYSTLAKQPGLSSFRAEGLEMERELSYVFPDDPEARESVERFELYKPKYC